MANNTKQIDKFDNYKKDKFIELYSRDEVRGNISTTCMAVGINRQTYYNWIEKDEKFRNIIKDVKLQLCDDMEQVLISRAVDKSDTALIFWLKYNHPNYKQEPTKTQKVEGDLNIQVINYDKKKGRPKVIRAEVVPTVSDKES